MTRRAINHGGFRFVFGFIDCFRPELTAHLPISGESDKSSTGTEHVRLASHAFER
jgi:hypothetical protein